MTPGWGRENREPFLQCTYSSSSLAGVSSYLPDALLSLQSCKRCIAFARKFKNIYIIYFLFTARGPSKIKGTVEDGAVF